MVKDKKKKASKSEQAAEAAKEQATEESKEQAAGEATEQTAQEEPKKKPKEGGGLLLTILTILLLVVGVGELALVAYMGFGALRGWINQRAYEAQLAANPGQPVSAVSVVGCASPWLTLENGVLTWRREDDLRGTGLAGSGITTVGSTGTGTGQTEYPLTPASPPRSWVWTIDSDVA